MENNIDKDINRCKELAKNLKEKFERISGAIAIMPRIEEEDVPAIENVLSELAKKDKQIKLEIEGRNILVHHNENLKSELETYEKIAKKLADILSHKMLEILGIKPRIEDLIESAKKEIENEKIQN